MLSMNKEVRSYIIYFGLLFICFILSSYADKKNNKKIIFVIALLLSLIMGLRKNTVGIDTNSYYYMFKSIKSISDVKKFSDPIFYVLAFLLMRIKNDPYFPILVFSFFSNFLVVYRLWDYRNISAYKYSILRYITIFYFFSFNCMRQFVAIAIVFWGTKHLEKGEYGKFLLYVIIASLIHLSSLVAASFVLLEVVRWKELSKKQRNYISISILFIPLYIVLAATISEGRYERYFSQIEISNFSSIVLKICLFIFVFIMLYSEKKFAKDNNKLLMCMIYYGIGLCLTSMEVFFRYFGRIGYYYYIYGTVYTGIAASEKRYQILFRIVILFIVIRAFYLNCSATEIGSMGQMPYLFNWE